MADTRTLSPAYNRKQIDGDTRLCELPWCGKINLRGDPGAKDFMNGAREILGAPLPLEANTVSRRDGLKVFWLGPDEWLVHCSLERIADLSSQLEQRLAGVRHAVTEVSDYYTVLELDGANAAVALARGCPMDLHTDVFRSGQCAQTRFGTASILLYRPGPDSVYRVQVRWSYCEYVWDYLASALDVL